MLRAASSTPASDSSASIASTSAEKPTTPQRRASAAAQATPAWNGRGSVKTRKRSRSTPNAFAKARPGPSAAGYAGGRSSETTTTNVRGPSFGTDDLGAGVGCAGVLSETARRRPSAQATASGCSIGPRSRMADRSARTDANTGAPRRSGPKCGASWTSKPSWKRADARMRPDVLMPCPPRPWIRRQSTPKPASKTKATERFDASTWGLNLGGRER